MPQLQDLTTTEVAELLWGFHVKGDLQLSAEDAQRLAAFLGVQGKQRALKQYSQYGSLHLIHPSAALC